MIDPESQNLFPAECAPAGVEEFGYLVYHTSVSRMKQKLERLLNFFESLVKTEIVRALFKSGIQFIKTKNVYMLLFSHSITLQSNASQSNLLITNP